MEPQSKFGSFMAHLYLGKQIETKGFISRRKIIRIGPLITTAGFLFETGAVLGRAMRDRLEILAYPFSGTEPDAHELAEVMRNEGREIAKMGNGATTVQEFTLITMMRQSQPTASLDDMGAWMLAHGNKEVSLEQAMESTLMLEIDGVCFGSEFPDRFEELYINSYGRPDPERWQFWVQAGLNIPDEPPEFVPLDVRTEQDLTLFANYCAEFYPDYVTKLGLQQYIGAS